MLRQLRYLAKIGSDTNFCASKKLRTAVYDAIFRAKTVKLQKTEKLLGCTIAFAREHIESLFLPGMVWGNKNLWQIDHYIPCSAFDLTDAWQQRLCNNWRNLRPLWSLENRIKWDTIPDDFEEKLNELMENVT